MKCRHCHAALRLTMVDLGVAPPSNAYLTRDRLNRPELWYPLRVLVCETCWLVQTEDYARADALFDADYAYFSSASASWLEHAAAYASAIRRRLRLHSTSFVVEIASNDGYLLKHFVAAGIPCLGIEPTAGTADAAASLGIPVLRQFFGADVAQRLAADHQRADLIIGNNVYAHVPDINDFTLGLKHLLKPDGTITLEFPHLLQLVRRCQFDTIYHEHFSYLSLGAVKRIFEAAGLTVYDVEVLSTHGGSLRVYGCHKHFREPSANVARVLEQEISGGLQTAATYADFQRRADDIKNHLLMFLIEHKRKGNAVAAYGAAAKGNTLLNYAGIRSDLLPFVCDAAPSKQGKFLPGSRIPILAPSVLEDNMPRILLVMPWNIVDEIRRQLSFLEKRGTRFAVAVPRLRLL